MIKFEIHSFNNQTEHDSFMDKLNKETAMIMHSVYQYYINELSHEKQKQMFHDWWYGKCVSKKDYQSELGISEELAYDVHSCILEACSRGFG